MNTIKGQRDAITAKINKTAYATPKTMMELERKDCRWPVGELYCAAPITKRSYCERHACIAHTGHRDELHS